MFIVLAVLAFGALIAFHEAGHMWVARRMGMRVERFSIGFGPTLFSWRRGETEYALSALPLGGYVKIAGMAPEDGVTEDDPGAFLNKPAWRRFLVIAAGPFANYLLAFLIGVPLLMSGTRVPDLESGRVGVVTPADPAAQAGLEVGDEIISVADSPFESWKTLAADITSAARAHPGEALPVLIRRGDTQLTLNITPRASGELFVLGVGPGSRPAAGLSLPHALTRGASQLVEKNVETLQMLGKMLTGRTKAQLSGPIGILDHTANQAKKGASDLFATVWGISVALGFFNLLPIPGLDGGRLMFLAYEVVARRRVNQKVEGVVHAVGIALLLGLILVVSYGDVMRKLGG